MGKHLSEEQIASFRRDGVVFPLRVFTTAEAQAQRAALEAIEASRAAHHGFDVGGSVEEGIIGMIVEVDEFGHTYFKVYRPGAFCWKWLSRLRASLLIRPEAPSAAFPDRWTLPALHPAGPAPCRAGRTPVP